MVVTIIPILLLSSALNLSQVVLPAHGAITGLVCIADPTGSKCPETPPILTPAAPSDTQITIGVFVNSSAALNGFEVILVADHMIIKPWKVDLTNSILGASPSITAQCIGGVARPGFACSSLDGPDTLHFGAVGTISFPPTTGLLFSATYNITGTTKNTPIDFKTGCGSTTNPTSDTPICVTITSGTPQPDPETTQSAGFSNQPFYAIDASPATLVTDNGASNSSLITLTSLNGFSGAVTLSGSVNPSGPTQSLFPTSISLTAGIQDFSTLSVTVGTTVAPGNYNITVTATTNSSFPLNSVIVHLIVPPPDFSISSSPATVTINATSSGSARLTLTSLNSFAGTVGLTLAPSSGLAASLNATQLRLQPGGSNSSASLTVSTSTGGTYTATITATSGQLTHRITVSVIALDFGVSSKLQSLSIPQGVNQTYTFTVTNAPLACCFLGNVTLSTSINPLTGGLAASCAPSLVVFNSRTGQSIDIICEFRGAVLGDYTVVLGGQGRGGKLFHAAVLTVHVQAPDFAITASPQSQTVQAGSNANITIIVTRQSIFNGTLNISASVSQTGPTTALNVSTVVINSSNNVGAVALTITFPQTFHPGTLTVTITAVNGSSPGALTHQTTVAITVAAPSTFHDVSIGSLTTDTTSPTVGDKVKYTIVVYDLGNFQEQVTVIALVGDTTVDQQNVTIQQGGNATVTLTWATSGWTPGTYVLGAKILNVSGEQNTGNNLLRSTTPENLNSTSQGLLSAGNLTLPIGILVAVIALIGVSIYLLRYRTRARTQTS
ncbi:MAG TPA: hypothetical protein VEL71_06020 [Candidatus Dormibacteraeota bacterium]|nr:hypothetical protein [Candidatus Dormibacteraeota bacterium]